MVAFLVDSDVVEACARAAEYAAKPEHWYNAATGENMPANVPELNVTAGAVHATFSFTKHAKVVVRHLSVSVIAGGGYPTPVAVFTFAHLLGFTGAKLKGSFVDEAGPDWYFQPNEQEGTIVVLQAVATPPKP